MYKKYHSLALTFRLYSSSKKTKMKKGKRKKKKKTVQSKALPARMPVRHQVETDVLLCVKYCQTKVLQ